MKENLEKSEAIKRIEKLRSNLSRELMVRDGISAQPPPSFLAMAGTALELLSIIQLAIIESTEHGNGD